VSYQKFPAILKLLVPPSHVEDQRGQGKGDWKGHYARDATWESLRTMPSSRGIKKWEGKANAVVGQKLFP